jgi:hypothetical protein
MLHQYGTLGAELALGTLLFFATLALNLAIVAAVLVRLPPDYCRPVRAKPLWRHRGAAAWANAIAKNLCGVILVLIGGVMALPGVPGQGLLTIFAGILLLDFPGRHRLVCKLLARPLLLQQVNRLRAKFAKPPLGVN